MRFPLALLLALALGAGRGTAAEPELPAVAPVDWSRVKLKEFRDDELDLPFYLEHFHTVANAVESDGPHRGFINLSVWRGAVHWYNARIMENILSLAWFYCAKRPWNPYYGDPAVRARLEAAMQFWCDSQDADGQFNEYAPGRPDLAATGFATKFMGEALLLLHHGPPLDPALLARADAADRRAIDAVLTLPELYAHGRSYTNQFDNVWSGGLAYFAFHPDPALRALWESRFHQTRADFQSPAGYYYEKDGPDFGYTMNTHGQSMEQEWSWLRDSPLRGEVVAKEAAWFGWLALNAAPEPDGSGFVLNRAIETRQRHEGFRNYPSPLGEFIPLVRAFAESTGERSARYRRERGQLAAHWPQVPPLPVGQFEAFGPYAFLHRRLHEWVPTTSQRNAARRLLPMIARNRFTEQLHDTRKDVVFSFVRRPAYYAAFAAGEQIAAQQRYGLGLLWTPDLGAVLQGQTGSDVAAWGTEDEGAEGVDEAGSLPADFAIGGAPAPAPQPGANELPTGDFAARYPLRRGGEKTVTFTDDAVAVRVSQPGAFTEVLPLLVPANGRVTLAPGLATLASPRGDFVVRFDAQARPEIRSLDLPVLDKQVVVLALRARDQLDYQLVPQAPTSR